MKKVLSLAAASVMLLSVASYFAGCGEAYTAEINWDVDLSQPVDLKGLYPETGLGAFGKDDGAKIIQEKTGYKMTYQEMGSNADNDVNNFLSVRADFDIMKLTEAQYHPYLEDGTFLDLTELLQKTSQGRTLYQLIDLMDFGWDSVTYTDLEGNKHIYGIPDFGFVCMTDSALVWNMDHLAKIGFKEKYNKDVPDQLGEVTWALEELQKTFGGNDQYHALGIPGSNSCEISQIKSAFDVPWQFYVDDNGKIQQYVYSPNVDNYVKYMNKLRKENILSEAWQNDSQSAANQKFAMELNSCTYISYWNVTPLINAIVDQDKANGGQIASKMGIKNDYETVRDNAVKWVTKVRGDGTSGSRDQEVARLEGDPGGVSYYTVIPAYMADRALYIIDFLTKKMEAFGDFYAGVEGDHWNKIKPGDLGKAGKDNGGYGWTENPVGLSADAPKAEDYTKEKDDEYAKYENLKEKIIFVRPYEYEYTKYTNKDPAAGNVLDENNMNEEKITVKGGGYWCQLTPRYIAHIADNSQYCNGTNAISAARLFHLRETGFDAWQVSDPEGEGRIANPMWMCPPMKWWAPVSILSRTLLKNGIASAIDADDCIKALNNAREGARTKKVTKDTVNGKETYYYWSDTISEEMTKWYNEVKVNRQPR